MVSNDLEEHVASIFKVEASQAGDVSLSCRGRVANGNGGRRKKGD